MQKSTERVLTFDIEGQEVRCFVSGRDRLWHCECERFKLNLARFKEGFCPHVAVAMAHALADGVIEPQSHGPRGGKKRG